MSYQRESQYFDVIGNGFVHEHHADGTHEFLVDTDKGGSSRALIWLAACGVAMVTAVIAGVSQNSSIVLASAG